MCSFHDIAHLVEERDEHDRSVTDFATRMCGVCGCQVRHNPDRNGLWWCPKCMDEVGPNEDPRSVGPCA